MKKLFSLFLALIASVGTLFAESGTCGDNLTWDLTDSVLTISGTGPMTDYSPMSSKPWNKTAIREIIISDGCSSIGNNIFEYCSNLTSVTISNSVTSIGTGSFDYCRALTSVNIPNSVTIIKDYAFRGCSAMTAITIPNSVSYIDEYAFSGCKSLISIEIPRGNIGNMAFANCQNLSSVIIGEGVTAIYGSDGPFYGCAKLKTVVWNAQNAKCTSSYGSEYELNPFRGGSASSITSFTFGENVRSIPTSLCYGMSSLTSITIPESVTSIGNNVFEGCSSLTTVVWNAANCLSPSSNGYAPFYRIREQITSFTLGNSVNSIPKCLCRGMSSLTSMIIPNSVISIGDEAFYDCSRLTSLTIPNSVTSIGEYAFYNCRALTSFSIPNPQTQCSNDILIGAQSLTSMSVPASALNISESSINYVTSHLQSLTVIGGEVSESGFLFITHSYRTLQTLDLGAATNTTLADEAFKGCYNLQSLVLPQNLTNISYMAVADCKNLQSINIPASVTEISQSAFENCRSLKTITFGGQASSAPGQHNAPVSSNSQLQTIGNWAFYNCHELQNLTIPEGVTYIGDGAFYGCTYLEDLTLSASVQSIGDNTFALCAKLQKIVVNAPVPPSIQAKTFFDVKRQIPVYVPDEAVSAYENDSYWGEFDIQGISHMLQGIDQVNQQQNANSQKLIKDGQILILRGDKTYTVTGQEVR